MYNSWGFVASISYSMTNNRIGRVEKHQLGIVVLQIGSIWDCDRKGKHGDIHRHITTSHYESLIMRDALGELILLVQKCFSQGKLVLSELLPFQGSKWRWLGKHGSMRGNSREEGTKSFHLDQLGINIHKASVM
jgi:hypothetical protein